MPGDVVMWDRGHLPAGARRERGWPASGDNAVRLGLWTWVAACAGDELWCLRRLFKTLLFWAFVDIWA